VDELHHSGKLAVVLPTIPARVRRQDQEHRPQPLTPAAYDVIGDLAYQNDLGLQASTNNVVHRPKIVGYELAKCIYGHVAAEELGDVYQL
jgi:hypothetical protein